MRRKKGRREMLMTAWINRRVKEPFWRDNMSLKLRTLIFGMRPDV
jgi:hypothetical protein